MEDLHRISQLYKCLFITNVNMAHQYLLFIFINMHNYFTNYFYVRGNKSTAIKTQMQCSWISHSRIRTFLGLSRATNQQVLALRLPAAGCAWLWHTAKQFIPFSKDQKWQWVLGHFTTVLQGNFPVRVMSGSGGFGLSTGGAARSALKQLPRKKTWPCCLWARM